MLYINYAPIKISKQINRERRALKVCRTGRSQAKEKRHLEPKPCLEAEVRRADPGHPWCPKHLAEVGRGEGDTLTGKKWHWTDCYGVCNEGFFFPAPPMLFSIKFTCSLKNKQKKISDAMIILKKMRQNQYKNS